MLRTGLVLALSACLLTACSKKTAMGGDAGDFHLSSTSPYKGTAPDGTDPGANIDAVNASTQ